MLNSKFISLVFALLLIAGCEIVQETQFKPNGSGTYHLSFDLSEMMKMGLGSRNGETMKQIDTSIVFAKLLKLHKDSIEQLGVEEQNKLKSLQDFSIDMLVDTASKKYLMRINYQFDNIESLKLFGEKLKELDFQKLDIMGKQSPNTKAESTNSIPDFTKFYDITFNRKKFIYKISEEGLREARKNKDTTMTKQNPMANMILVKSRYYFPFKIKNVSNENAKILSDARGIEIDGNLFEVSNNPRFFDLEVVFD